MSAGDPTVLVVIVNYRTGGLTIDCLATLEPEVKANPGTSVVVTDNASGDGSIDVIAAAITERGWSGWARTQPLDRNGGFAYGNNAAIEPAIRSDHPPDFVWLLNPDTLVQPGALTELIRFLQANPAVGMAGSRLENPDGSRQWSAFAFPTIVGELDHGARFGPLRRLTQFLARDIRVTDREPTPVEWVAGASLLVRRAVFDAVGLLDDGFFMYYEEVDFIHRALKAGWPCWYVPTSRVVHLVGQSSGVSDPRKAARRVPGYWFEARRRYMHRNRGRLWTLLADLAWTGGAITFLARNLVQRKPAFMPDRYFRDFVRHSFLPAAKPR